jgi:hypothetical protein
LYTSYSLIDLVPHPKLPASNRRDKPRDVFKQQSRSAVEEFGIDEEQTVTDVGMHAAAVR